MTDIARLFQAFLAPAIFVSATALLILSINVRLMGMVSRLRQYVHAKHDAAKNNRVQDQFDRTACGNDPALLPSGARFSCRDDCIVSTAGLRPLLERGSDRGRRALCRSNDLLADRNLLLHPRSHRGPEFGAQRGLRFAIHGAWVSGPRFGAAIRCARRGDGVPSNTVTACQSSQF